MRQAAITGVLGLTRARVAALCLGLLAAAFLAVSQPGTARAADYPGQAEIDAAQAAADSQASSVAQLDAAVAQLESALADAQSNEYLMADRYSQALGDLQDAQDALALATQRSAEAQAALKIAQDDLASVAMAAYRDGGSMDQITAVLSADGFADAVVQSESMSRASDETSVKVQRVEAAQLVADTMKTVADAAAVKAAGAELTAKDALDAATAASAAAKVAVTDAATAKTAAVSRLAELQGTTVALEQQRQDGLAAEREAARKAAALKAQQEAEAQLKKQQAAEAAALKKQQDAAAALKAQKDAEAALKAQQEADAAEAASNSTPVSTPKPTTTSTPKPTTDPTPDPAPAEDSGAWRSTAAQGKTAAAKAVSLVGSPYEWGGNGPSYDCSGLTSTAWRAAGFSIPRSSGTQYAGLTHIAFSQLRPGDLIFYGVNRDASRIYHVAIYIGNGNVVEATVPGDLAKIRGLYSWGASQDLMPYAARP